MNFEEFVEEVKSRIKNYLPDRYASASVSTNQINKIGEIYLGLAVKTADMAAVPMINLNQFYEEFRGDMDELLREVSGIITSNEMFEDTSWLLDYDKVKEHLFVRISNTERNAGILENAPHRNMEDLSMTYHIRVDVPGKGQASTLITNQALKMYGISEEELHHDTLINSMKIFPAYLNTMDEMVGDILTHNPDMGMIPNPLPYGNALLVLTNEEKTNGASALFYPGIMDVIANIMKGDYFILPSSIHEVILMPKRMGKSVEELEQIVKNANKTNVSSNEFLSNHVYHYDAKERLFERGDKYEARMNDLY